MRCPNCSKEELKVEWTRHLWTHTSRGVHCKGCLITFETVEVPLLPKPERAVVTGVHAPEAQLDQILDRKLAELGAEPTSDDDHPERWT